MCDFIFSRWCKDRIDLTAFHDLHVSLPIVDLSVYQPQRFIEFELSNHVCWIKTLGMDGASNLRMHDRERCILQVDTNTAHANIVCPFRPPQDYIGATGLTFGMTPMDVFKALANYQIASFLENKKE